MEDKKDIVRQLEEIRSNKFNEFKKNLIIGILTLVFIVGVYFIIKAISIYNDFNNTYKQDFISKIITGAFDDIQYNHKKGLQKYEVLNQEMFQYPDRFLSSDYLEGFYKSVKIRSANLKLEKKVQTTAINSKGQAVVQTYYVEYFKGRWMVFEFNKRYEDVIKIKESRFIDGMSTRGLQKVDTESINFNKKFRLYTSSKKHLFYILTPKIIENLLEIEKMHKGKIMYSFDGNTLHVGVDDKKEYFKMRFSKKIDSEVVSGIYQQANIMSKIVDKLDLNTSKFNKK